MSERTHCLLRCSNYRCKKTKGASAPFVPLNLLPSTRHCQHLESFHDSPLSDYRCGALCGRFGYLLQCRLGCSLDHFLGCHFRGSAFGGQFLNALV